MKAFDWQRLFTEQHITFITTGANVKRGELAIQCPFCGSADPSKHMGVSLETGWWSCWRNKSQHSGKSPLRLIMRLLGVPYGRAREIAGLGDDYVDPEGFDAIAARLMGRDKSSGRAEETQRRFLDLDPDFRPINRDERRLLKFWNYLDSRGFDRRSDDVAQLCKDYGLLAGVGYPWSDRVIMPYIMDGHLVTWTARAIGPAAIRYKDLSLDECLLGPKETLYNHDSMLTGGKVLAITEGPFDALKLDFYGKALGCRSVALSTNSIKEEQAYLLQAASQGFDKVVVMLDNATSLGIVDSMRMKQALYFIKNVSIQSVPAGRKDAGDLSPREVRAWASLQ